MEFLNIDVIHKECLRMLKEFIKVCDYYKLNWFLDSGSLLGYAQNGHIIPWDDDMDVAMPREDYEALILHSDEWLPSPLEFVCYENDKKYPLHFGKIQDASTTLIERPHLYYLGGVYLDIFPIDGAPEGKLRQRLYNFKYKMLTKALYFHFRDPYRHGHGPSCWLPLLIRKLFTMDGLQQKIKKNL